MYENENLEHFDFNKLVKRGKKNINKLSKKTKKVGKDLKKNLPPMPKIPNLPAYLQPKITSDKPKRRWGYTNGVPNGKRMATYDYLVDRGRKIADRARGEVSNNLEKAEKEVSRVSKKTKKLVNKKAGRLANDFNKWAKKHNGQKEAYRKSEAYATAADRADYHAAGDRKNTKLRKKAHDLYDKAEKEYAKSKRLEKTIDLKDLKKTRKNLTDMVDHQVNKAKTTLKREGRKVTANLKDSLKSPEQKALEKQKKTNEQNSKRKKAIREVDDRIRELNGRITKKNEAKKRIVDNISKAKKISDRLDSYKKRDKDLNPFNNASKKEKDLTKKALNRLYENNKKDVNFLDSRLNDKKKSKKK